MPLEPLNEVHALQIQAGTLGRKAGHQFEDAITAEINAATYPMTFDNGVSSHVRIGDPALNLLHYIADTYGQNTVERVVAISTGALATSEEGRKWLDVNGANVRRCKIDLVITMHFQGGRTETVGVSTKQCNNSSPTNAQLYFTTARGFVSLLRTNGTEVSDAALTALRQFCGDAGFRPSDSPQLLLNRVSDPRRFFWEETDAAGRTEWETVFQARQDEITRLMLQKAYIDDPFIPDILLHKTRRSDRWITTETAIYTMTELISSSALYGGFSTKGYSVRKGSFRDPLGVVHQAPRFGIVQMQRGGQAQHPEQLQFNLEAGYFYKIKQSRS